MVSRPIFYDPSGRRRRRFAVAVAAFAMLLLLAVGVFAASIVAVPPQGQLPFEIERPALHGLPSPIVLMARRAGKRLRRTFLSSSWVAPKRHGPFPSAPLAVGFYAPWDDASAASLARHIGDLDWLVPGWISVTGADHRLTMFPDRRGRAIIAQAARRPLLLPMVQNAIEGQWDGAGAAALLHDPVARRQLLDRLVAFLTQNHADGVMFDFEDIPASAQQDYLQFLREAKAAFGPRHMLITIAAPVENEEWNLAAFGGIADKIFLMAYDEHSPPGEPGPVASQSWFVRVVTSALGKLPPGKAIVALGSYAYDWANDHDGEGISVEQAWLTAHESQTMPTFDRPSGNAAFAYEEAGKTHNVWILDAASLFNEVVALRSVGANAFGLWRLGTEDPSVWTIFGKDHDGPVPAKSIERIPAGTNVDIEGTGEILKVGAVPVPGLRAITTDRSGLITNQTFALLPLPYTIERAGYRPGLVALTFDDGPDPVWTPKILDILKSRHVPGTFFIIGENALTQRRLLDRIVREGNEVGNHTYTHPNLGEATPRETELELNATQRLFQAFTGRSMRLFRAPFFGDAEPTTADEINPVATAQQLGYLSVGLHVDPGDWKRPGAQQIVDRTIEQVLDSDDERSGQIVLLHDAGGDRSQTVAALPAIIDGLEQRGYRFVPVSALINLSRDAAMPPLSKGDQVAARADLALFTSLGFVVVGLRWLFAIAITLGIARALLLSALALRQARREARKIFRRSIRSGSSPS
jgi:peptidoglycan/xylan/chitin deacetylase (PgdA/CDA1 family)/spore germination protein YaaH